MSNIKEAKAEGVRLLPTATSKVHYMSVHQLAVISGFEAAANRIMEYGVPTLQAMLTDLTKKSIKPTKDPMDRVKYFELVDVVMTALNKLIR